MSFSLLNCFFGTEVFGGVRVRRDPQLLYVFLLTSEIPPSTGYVGSACLSIGTTNKGGN
jgi:hypothetical protein